MRAPPPGWPRISAAVFYLDPAAAIDWLCAAFGFQVRLRVEGHGGRIEHSELELPGDGLIMVGGAGPAYADRDAARPYMARIASPKQLDGRFTANLAVHVDDVDAHCRTARAAGAEIVYEPTTTDYGDDYWADRSYAAVDPEGHLWWFMQRMRTGGGGPSHVREG
ncbi:MAG: VOC family protein [Planctomycetota bacterium]